ncbi:C40 family peptidase [Viridibacillus arvi]|uniref:C40 family peptidase n=1 Tax=Viridibacillus arvi TaxID=263475 RepID=UPI0034CF3564
MAKEEKKILVDYNDTLKKETILQDDFRESQKRRLLNLPQQPSINNNNNNQQSNIPSNPNKYNNRKDDKKMDNEDRRKNRDQDHSKKQQTSNHSNQNNTNEDRRNPNSLKNNLQDKGKGELKKQGKKQLKTATKKGTEKVAEKGVKKALKQGAKIAAKAVKQLVVKGIALISKALLALISTVGLPAVLIGISIVILFIILMTISTMVLGTGQGVDELGPEAKELRAYIVKKSAESVDPNRPEQQQYKIPEELLAAVVQLESFLSEDGNDGSIEKYKALIDEFAAELYPEFEYKKFTEWTMTSTKVCTKTTESKNKDGTKSSSCEKYEWSSPSKSETQVEKITKVLAWNGTGTYEYEAEESDWVVSGDTKTKTLEYVMKEQSFIYDFSKLDSILNSHGYELEDKKWFEYFYESATNVQMHYIEWIETGVVSGGGNGGYDGDYGGGSSFDGSIIPGGGVPPEYMKYYLAAEKKYGVDWYILASIHFHETTFSTNPNMTSNVGAIGHMQFMPKTWIGWSYPGGTDLGNLGISMDVLTNPAMIKKYGGIGTDANGDGKADPWNLEDAIHTAAKYLASNNYKGNPRNAIYHYNHEDAYINNILATGEKFKNAATYKPGGGAGGGPNVGNSPEVVKKAIAEASKYLGRAYVWGGYTPSMGFDCSGIIQWSYGQQGVKLPRVSRDQYKFTKRISESQAKPGDLVFFAYDGRGTIAHVGIYLGGGQMLNAQNNGVIIEPLGNYWRNFMVGFGRIPGINE